MNKYLSIFSSSTASERSENFQNYWEFTQKHSGSMDEAEKNLSRKKEKLAYFQANPVRSEKPLANPDVFYRNYVHMQDAPSSLDQKTLLLTCIYKFARHEWVGISGAWDYLPPLAKAKTLTDKISRYHLAEEFCHVRYFHEMFRTFRLDRVEWVPLGPIMGRIYKMFPYFPESWMSPPAFVTELMGITFYRHVDALLDRVFADEPLAAARVRELLHEIMVDEIAHIGQRRNFMGKFGIWVSKKMVGPLYRAFFNDIPEAKFLFDIPQMIRDGQAFDYSSLSPELLERSWIPSYCKAA